MISGCFLIKSKDEDSVHRNVCDVAEGYTMTIKQCSLAIKGYTRYEMCFLCVFPLVLIVCQLCKPMISIISLGWKKERKEKEKDEDGLRFTA